MSSSIKIALGIVAIGAAFIGARKLGLIGARKEIPPRINPSKQVPVTGTAPKASRRPSSGAVA